MPIRNGEHRVKREPRELLLLFDISQILDRSLDLRDVVGPVLESIAKHMGMMRGTLTLLNRESGEIFHRGCAWTFREPNGARPVPPRRRGHRKGHCNRPAGRGASYLGRAPILGPNRSQERGCAKEDISFICVPIKLGNEVIGALSADRLFQGRESPSTKTCDCCR